MAYLGEKIVHLRSNRTYLDDGVDEPGGAHDLLGTAVRVTDIEPGLAGGTEFSRVRFHGDESKAASVYAGTTPLQPEDIADAIHWVATRPPHVNVNSLQIMPVAQAFGPLAVKRTGGG